MKTDRVEYHISGTPQNTWQIFRQNMQIGFRRCILDAIRFATQIAEREATLSLALTKVTIDNPLRSARGFELDA